MHYCVDIIHFVSSHFMYYYCKRTSIQLE